MTSATNTNYPAYFFFVLWKLFHCLAAHKTEVKVTLSCVKNEQFSHNFNNIIFFQMWNVLWKNYLSLRWRLLIIYLYFSIVNRDFFQAIVYFHEQAFDLLSSDSPRVLMIQILKSSTYFRGLIVGFVMAKTDQSLTFFSTFQENSLLRFKIFWET